MVNSLVTDRIHAALKAQKSNKEAETNPTNRMCSEKKNSLKREGGSEEISDNLGCPLRMEKVF